MPLMNVNEAGSATVVGHVLKRSKLPFKRVDHFDADSDVVIAALHRKHYRHVVINCIDDKRGASVAVDVVKHFPQQSVVLVSAKQFEAHRAFPMIAVVPSALHVADVLERHAS